MSGKTIGRYEIVRELGRGGMATVYLGHDPKLERQVAIKVLPSQFANDPEFFDRFEQEAKTLATLQHNAIVSLYDSGEDEGFPYFIMQLMGGGSLKDKITDSSLESIKIISIFNRIAAALDKAHNAGIIHRDVKPSNILFDEDDEAYLSDFGIVKLTQAADGVTRTRGSIGTPHYMSPEQLDGVDDLDSRSDIYALAIVLYETLVGDPPYNHTSSPRIMVMHLNEPVPNILEKRPDLPSKIDAIIKKGMAKDRENRYAKASDLAADLDAALRNWVPGAETAESSSQQLNNKEKEIATSVVSQAEKSTPAPPTIAPTTKEQPISPALTPKQTAARSTGNLPLLYALAGAGGVAVIILGVIGFALLRDSGGETEPTATTIAIVVPTKTPTKTPTETATEKPTVAPTQAPTETATLAPVVIASKVPTSTPSPSPTPTEAPTETATQEPTQTPTPAIGLDDALEALGKSEDLLQFSELFENITDSSSNPLHKFHSDGVTLASEARSSTIAYLPFNKSPDGYYETEIEFVEGDMTNGWAGLILRVSEKGDRYYTFEINGEGQVRGALINSVSGRTQYISASRLFDNNGQQIDTGIGTKNTLGIEIDGTKLEFFINGSNRGRFSFKDTSLPAGGVGLSTRVDNRGEKVQINFSYLIYK